MRRQAGRAFASLTLVLGSTTCAVGSATASSCYPVFKVNTSFGLYDTDTTYSTQVGYATQGDEFWYEGVSGTNDSGVSWLLIQNDSQSGWFPEG